MCQFDHDWSVTRAVLAYGGNQHAIIKQRGRYYLGLSGAKGYSSYVRLCSVNHVKTAYICLIVCYFQLMPVIFQLKKTKLNKTNQFC